MKRPVPVLSAHTAPVRRPRRWYPSQLKDDADRSDESDVPPELNGQSVFERVKAPQISTKKSAHQSSVFFAGVEIAVRVNHVDPLTDGRRDVKSNWVADGEHASVDLETVIKRKQLPKDFVLELQGPALTAKADADQMLPLKARFIGVGLSKQWHGDMPHDDTDPRVEVKVEVKLTDKSIGSLAGLAGASQELGQFAAELAATPAANIIGNILTAAVPVVSAVVAGFSIKRAIKTVRDDQMPVSSKVLSVLRALADVTTVFFPLAGTIANIALVGAAIGVARRDARLQAGTVPVTKPPTTGDP